MKKAGWTLLFLLPFVYAEAQFNTDKKITILSEGNSCVDPDYLRITGLIQCMASGTETSALAGEKIKAQLEAAVKSVPGAKISFEIAVTQLTYLGEANLANMASASMMDVYAQGFSIRLEDPSQYATLAEKVRTMYSITWNQVTSEVDDASKLTAYATVAALTQSSSIAATTAGSMGMKAGEVSNIQVLETDQGSMIGNISANMNNASEMFEDDFHQLSPAQVCVHVEMETVYPLIAP